ncbi:hypothetical protein MCOR04_002175 [Pyricularia oryzae]|nr:hypothetical protein MCOR04_002175 [Pyricularia oryzae]
MSSGPAGLGHETARGLDAHGGVSVRSTRGHHHAPSLDAIATQNTEIEDSRSSSSTNSPVPNENEESDFFLGANDSQSSLGVPNLQDMQVTDDYDCLAAVNKLPNEILISIFSRLSSTADLRNCMLTCKRWARNTVDQLWHRPSCTSWDKHAMICRTLTIEYPYFSYKHFVKRLNLAQLAEKVNDGSVMPLAVCNRVERLTLPNCKGLTDSGLTALVTNNDHLLALDMSGVEQATDASVLAIAEHCKRLQGLNVSGCTRISSEAMAVLAQSCRYIKRLKLNECRQLGDEAVLAFAENCPNLLEIDLLQCRLVGNASITALLSKGQSLRELRLVFCELIDDGAFLSLPRNRTYEHLRILDLTSCIQLTDRAVERIIEVAPRLRNLVLSKCRAITDTAVYAISKLGKNLHYVHLGHCQNITDEAVKRLVHCCTRIRYIDLGCCIHLTDESVTKLATLPKLKRIGLVKCSGITDESILALAKANQKHRQRRDHQGNPIHGSFHSQNSLERVHLSYCTNLTLRGIIKLLQACPKLTHLSLTGVQAFLRDDLAQFCRDAPQEFTENQRNVFCVFSGQGVVSLRRYLNTNLFDDFHDRPARRHSVPGGGVHTHPPGQVADLHATLDASFDDQEPDTVEDDAAYDADMTMDGAIPPPPPPPPPAPGAPNTHYQSVFPGYPAPDATVTLEGGLAGPSHAIQQEGSNAGAGGFNAPRADMFPGGSNQSLNHDRARGVPSLPQATMRQDQGFPSGSGLEAGLAGPMPSASMGSRHNVGEDISPVSSNGNTPEPPA